LTSRTKLAYSGSMSSDDDKIQQIRTLTARIAQDKAQIMELIPQVFPENRGERAVRGRLTEVADASGWTREYVARIRDAARKGNASG
jgi:hypothetical protein